jgi:hypothetical protein
MENPKDCNKEWSKYQLSDIAATFCDKRKFVFGYKDLHDVNQILVDRKVGNFIATWDPKHPVIEAIENRALELMEINSLDLRMKRIEDMLENLIQRTETMEFGLSENEVKLTATKEENEILAVATSRILAHEPTYSVEEAATLKCVKPQQVRSAIKCGTLEAVPTAKKHATIRVTKESLIAWTPRAPRKIRIEKAEKNAIEAPAPVVENTVVEDLLDHVLNVQMFPESIPAPVYERPVFTHITTLAESAPTNPGLKIGVLGDRGKRWIKPGLFFGNHSVEFIDSDKLRKLNGNYDYLVLTGFHGHKATNLVGDVPICRINVGNGIFTQVRTPNQLKNWLALHEKDMVN